MITFFTLLLLILSIIYYFSLSIQKNHNPTIFYLFFSLISTLGTYPLLQIYDPIDRIYFYLCSFYTLSIILGSIIGKYLFPVSNSDYIHWRKKPITIENGFYHNIIVKTTIGFAVFIGILYYYVVGYNIFILGLSNLVIDNKQISDVSTMRLASYNQHVGGKYLFPGYVNQFKNTLLPIFLSYLIIKYKIIYNKVPIFLYTLIPVTIVLLFGTGQRGAFVLTALIIGYCLFYLYNIKYRRLLLMFGSLGVLSLFLLSSFFIGRTSTTDINTGVLNNIKGLFESFLYRITTANQEGAVIGFRRIIFNRPIQYGLEWKQAIIGLLPGIDGSKLSSEIFNVMFGGGNSIRGNAPPSTVGSIYHNFGSIGVIMVPVLLSITLQYLYYRLLSRNKSLFRIFIYISSFILLSTWIAGSPTYYFNVGLITLFLFYLFLKFISLGGKVRSLYTNYKPIFNNN